MFNGSVGRCPKSWGFPKKWYPWLVQTYIYSIRKTYGDLGILLRHTSFYADRQLVLQDPDWSGGLRRLWSPVQGPMRAWEESETYAQLYIPGLYRCVNAAPKAGAAWLEVKTWLLGSDINENIVSTWHGPLRCFLIIGYSRIFFHMSSSQLIFHPYFSEVVWNASPTRSSVDLAEL